MHSRNFAVKVRMVAESNVPMIQRLLVVVVAVKVAVVVAAWTVVAKKTQTLLVSVARVEELSP